MRRLPALALALALLLPASASAQGGVGNLFVADNATTAATAAAAAPLQPAALGNHTVNLPAGFSIRQIADGLKAPRFMVFDQAGNLLVAEAGAGAVDRLFSSPNGFGSPTTLISGLDAPSSLALNGGELYVGETGAVSRYAYDPAGAAGQREVVVPDLPRGGHSTRTVVFGPDGDLYVGVGSSCNICTDGDQRRAAINRYDADGSKYERFAYGLRNAVGLAFQPGGTQLWATVNERDNQGNEIPPDLVTIVGEGENFGWPNCQPPNATPQQPGADCSDITPPTVGLQAHGAPLGLAFYEASQFPGDYSGDLFVAQHGSWNRQPPAAPKLVRLHFEQGLPVSAMDFATGWQAADGSRWGRPAGVVVAPDGSLIVSDDDAGVLYQIDYHG
ncbi:MAG: PQQ-dependent sugar dehydrogenase [Chloroflexi bacterium]|nr:PQQ-dependent sugar dehydrogenase [Chloroflexota bacterium]